MDNNHEHDDRPAYRSPWNKGKLIGAKTSATGQKLSNQCQLKPSAFLPLPKKAEITQHQTNFPPLPPSDTASISR